MTPETPTILYLIRHGAAEGAPGRRDDPPLARLGVRQAEATRDFLAVRPLDYCYCSPQLPAAQTAAIVAGPHGLTPRPLPELADPGAASGGVAAVLDELLERHAGAAILVVSHHAVHRAYLAGVLGLSPVRAGQVNLDNCGISVVVRQAGATTVSTLNAAFHLQGVAA